MSLIEETLEACTMLGNSDAGDGQFGWNTTWTDGEAFQASIVKNSTVQKSIAEAQRVTEAYTVTVDRAVTLRFHDVFRREATGETYRVTSNIEDSRTPARASFQIGQVTAERWDLPE